MIEVYHECNSKGPGFVRLQATNKRLPYMRSITELMVKQESADPIVPMTIRYWQPYHCHDCNHTVYELVGNEKD